jgi:hypothetical protein
MKLSNFIEGLQILQQYFDKDGYKIGAEHDEFYVYKTDRPVSHEHVERLKFLDWFQPGQEEQAPYDPEESWQAFT